MWSGPLDNGDQVVALLNGGSVARPMNTTLEEIFFDSNLGSKELTSTWDIYDLWANRVDNSTASAILEQNKAATGILYNATEQSYKDGLSKNDTRLFGQKIGSLSPNAILNTTVPAHGIAFYRLRPRLKLNVEQKQDEKKKIMIVKKFMKKKKKKYSNTYNRVIK
ncbi:AHL_G0017750.mRNA.1.CDS.1 [Saccharomyces cerevisiae]|nr:AHL_G0017750.mRNA.1.CDS.1 [Saccharomyces cerevisiae]CAI6651446.1 AHL_G0017750.mRNA.1.CDS.1 [Saccharomyces cerevisiae]